jgi:hypothetical protein
MMDQSIGTLAARSEALCSSILFRSKVTMVVGLIMMFASHHFIRAFANNGGLISA